MHTSAMGHESNVCFFFPGRLKLLNFFCLPAEERKLFGRFLQIFLFSENFFEGKKDKQW
jgi:hypothetical protein